MELPKPESGYASARILVVDDEDTNVRTLSRILRAAGYTNIVATTDPTRVLALYAEQEPDLVLLDLHMPVLDGVAVLERLAEVATPHSYVPVLVLTGDSSREARRSALSKGGKDFLTKPFEVDEVLLRIRNLLETKYLHREIATENVLLEQRVKERTADLEGAHLDTLERLAVAAEFRDDETGKHTERVASVAALLARAAGLEVGEIELVRRAAPLHDLGKIGIPDAIRGSRAR
jgi:putative two-component system response regulator